MSPLPVSSSVAQFANQSDMKYALTPEGCDMAQQGAAGRRKYDAGCVRGRNLEDATMGLWLVYAAPLSQLLCSLPRMNFAYFPSWINPSIQSNDDLVHIHFSFENAWSLYDEVRPLSAYQLPLGESGPMTALGRTEKNA